MLGEKIMLKALKPFLIYNFVIGSLGILRRALVFNLIMFVGIFTIIMLVQIFGALKYGRDVARDFSISFLNKLLLGIFVFLFNYIACLIPYIGEIFYPNNYSEPIPSANTLLPALLFILIFYCCILYPKLKISILEGTKFGKILNMLKPFGFYIFIIIFLKSYQIYIKDMPNEEVSGFEFFFCVELPILWELAPCIFGIWYGNKISKISSSSLLQKISIGVILFGVNALVYHIPDYSSYMWDNISERGTLRLIGWRWDVFCLPPTLLIVSFVISLGVSKIIDKGPRNIVNTM